jgi:ADP-ribose pyrophosphatase YjhB (NUDIX family)
VNDAFGQTARIWKPSVTVAAVIERDGAFLLVEEEAHGRIVFNQPAGHWEPGESLAEACARETLEETAHHFRPDELLGVYRWHLPDADTTFLRFAFRGAVTWEVRPDGSAAVNLTSGAADRIRHRRAWLHPDDRVVDPSRPIYVTLYGDRTKQFGYGRIRPGGGTERLLLLDRNVSRLTKADSADVFMYRVEAFDDSPDIFVAGPRLADAPPPSGSQSRAPGSSAHRRRVHHRSRSAVQSSEPLRVEHFWGLWT